MILVKNISIANYSTLRYWIILIRRQAQRAEEMSMDSNSLIQLFLI